MGAFSHAYQVAKYKALCRRHLLANRKRFGFKSAKDTFHFSFMKITTMAWVENATLKSWAC